MEGVKRNERLVVKVISPFETFYEGNAVSLSAKNKTGPFDVLFNHGNFFSLLTPGRIVINTGFDKVQVEITSGVIQVFRNKVVVFANV